MHHTQTLSCNSTLCVVFWIVFWSVSGIFSICTGVWVKPCLICKINWQRITLTTTHCFTEAVTKIMLGAQSNILRSCATVNVCTLVQTSTLNHNRNLLVYYSLGTKQTVYMCYTKRVKLDCVPGSCVLTEMTLCSCMGGSTTGHLWLMVCLIGLLCNWILLSSEIPVHILHGFHAHYWHIIMYCYWT
jgi:hypothetical protein